MTMAPKTKTSSQIEIKKGPKKSRKRGAEESAEELVTSPPVKKGSAAYKPCSVDDAFKTHKNKMGEVLLDPKSMASYIEDDIWAVLQECGYCYNNSGFDHPEIDRKEHKIAPENFGHEDGLRKFLCLHGVANIEDLKDRDDVEALKKWVAFANVPLKESTFEKVLGDLVLPSDDQALECLKKLGFRVEEGTKNIYRPKQDGMDYFHSLEDARRFVRSADDTVLLTIPEAGDNPTPRKRSRRSKAVHSPLTDDELLSLRVWAAVSPSPLPGFEKQTTQDGDESSDEEREIPADSRVGPSTCVIL